MDCQGVQEEQEGRPGGPGVLAFWLFPGSLAVHQAILIVPPVLQPLIGAYMALRGPYEDPYRPLISPL